jgi:2'-phosphotransferase
MAAAVLPSMQSLSLDREIMPPSPVSQNSTRHGRSRHGGSIAKSKARGRGYSIVDEREGLVTKALSRALRRTVEEDGEQEEGDGRLVAGSEGWVDCEEVVSS